MKLSGSKAKGGHTRSLHIKLPGDHPVFLLPDGERSRVARKWLEQGRQVTKAMEELKREIREIKEYLQQCGKREQLSQFPEQDDNTESQSNTIDPAVFLKI